jgi:diadenosine tetraphosphate (Ap4A) HIT family hydrolase
MSDYEQLKIKIYSNWDLFLHENQYPYIGRCYAWAKRDNANLVTEMTVEERDEIFDYIIPAWHNSISEIFGKNRPNIAILGNEAPHLHAHLIPRYQFKMPYCYGMKFEDPNPKGNYSPYEKKKLPLEILLEIKNKIASKL